MHRIDEETHLNAEEATGGSQEHVVRWILGISLLLIVIAMSVIWIVPSLT
ncbi:hypothetical protein ACFQPG_02250 [Sphingomonas sp. GCM10030256]